MNSIGLNKATEFKTRLKGVRLYSAVPRYFPLSKWICLNLVKCIEFDRHPLSNKYLRMYSNRFQFPKMVSRMLEQYEIIYAIIPITITRSFILPERPKFNWMAGRPKPFGLLTVLWDMGRFRNELSQRTLYVHRGSFSRVCQPGQHPHKRFYPVWQLLIGEKSGCVFFKKIFLFSASF